MKTIYYYNCPYCKKEISPIEHPPIDSHDYIYVHFECPQCHEHFDGIELGEPIKYLEIEDSLNVESP